MTEIWIVLWLGLGIGLVAAMLLLPKQRGIGKVARPPIRPQAATRSAVNGRPVFDLRNPQAVVADWVRDAMPAVEAAAREAIVSGSSVNLDEILLGEKAAPVEGFAPGARPLCIFCNAPWSDEMIWVYDVDARHGEGSWDFGPEDQQATVDITCSTCNRLIYRKEFRGGEDSPL